MPPIPKIPPTRRPNALSRGIKPIRNPPPVRGPGAISKPPVAKPRRLCPNPACTTPKIEDGYCTSCGSIVDESNIVAEIQFGESSSGAAVVQGSFIGADQGGARSMGPAFRRAGASEDRERSQREGKQLMTGIANSLRISESTLGHAHSIFRLASNNNFIQGRRIDTVAAVCLYAACRMTSPCRVMLMDFADNRNINVFKLGHVYKALFKAVPISDKPVELQLPEDLIYRFAMKLDFGDDTDKIAEQACRLVRRMQKDWMITGRRPSGVCGACIILAARMYNYRRTVQEVTYIVKVTTATVQKRLDEFKETASSSLTVEEFLQNDFLEAAHDPPAFYQQTEEWKKTRKTRKRKRPILPGDDEEDYEDGEEDEVVRLGQPRTPNAATSVTPALEGTPPVTYPRDADGFVIPPKPFLQGTEQERPENEIPIDPSLLNPEVALESLAMQHGGDDVIPNPEETEAEAANEHDEDWEADEQALQKEIEAEIQDASKKIQQSIADPNTREHALAFETGEARARIISMFEASNNPQKQISMDVHIGEDEFANDDEVKFCILSEAEASFKEKIWYNENKDWLHKQQEKRHKAERAAAGPPKATRKRKKKPRIGEAQTEVAESPAAAATAAMKERAWSKRINYDSITALFNTKNKLGSAATSRVTSRAASVASSDVGSDIHGSSVAGSDADAGNALLSEVEEEDTEINDWEEA